MLRGLEERQDDVEIPRKKECFRASGNRRQHMVSRCEHFVVVAFHLFRPGVVLSTREVQKVRLLGTLALGSRKILFPNRPRTYLSYEHFVQVWLMHLTLCRAPFLAPLWVENREVPLPSPAWWCLLAGRLDPRVSPSCIPTWWRNSDRGSPRCPSHGRVFLGDWWCDWRGSYAMRRWNGWTSHLSG